MLNHRTSRSPFATVLLALGRAAQVLFGLALLAGTALLGLLLLGGLLVRSLFTGQRGAVVRMPSATVQQSAGQRSPVSPSRRPMGEVVDIEAREVGPTAQ